MQYGPRGCITNSHGQLLRPGDGLVGQSVPVSETPSEDLLLPSECAAGGAGGGGRLFNTVATLRELGSIA